MPSSQRRPDPPPLDTDDRRTVAVGMGVWAVLLVVAVVRYDSLAAQGRGWWVWTPVVGIALGIFGLYYLRRHNR